MNKSALKKFATEARRELLERIELQARKLGITADSIQKANVESSDAIFIDGRQLSDTERKQRNKLIARINEIGFNRVIEETAYTWFNRFIALRFMEVNEFLPTKVRVLSSTNPNSAEPDMMKEALSLDLPIDKEYVYNLKMDNKTDELFKYLIKMHCNDLNRYMPFMFEKLADYTEILFPEGLLGKDSFLSKMTSLDVIKEEDWTKVEIVGWMYQYYISEENERVIQAKNKYKKEEIPYATQLFTPEWIVRYMVQNALGRYWVESHTEHRDLIENWEFYLENQNPEPDFEEKLAPYINKELNVEDIKCFDPAMGSGHILSYMFDVLYEIYVKCGYMEREIPRLIIEKNLYGLDIDDRAYQLASFTVVMKALQYNKRFLRSIEREGLEMNLAAIQETNNLTEEEIAYLAGMNIGEDFEKMKAFIQQFKDAKAIGSLLKIEEFDKTFIKQRIESIEQQEVDLFDLDLKNRVMPLMKQLIKQASIMVLQYDVLVTNPPYAGKKYLTKDLDTYLNKYYSNFNKDLFVAFMMMSKSKVIKNGQLGFITPYVWMFISSYEVLRKTIINENTISSLIQLEYNAFEAAVVPVCALSLRNYLANISGEYIRLADFKGAKNQPIKTLEAIKNPDIEYRYSTNQEDYMKIPGNPIAYWIKKSVFNSFSKFPPVSEMYKAIRGLETGNNAKFIREWFEISTEKYSLFNLDYKTSKWFPYNKGGGYRRWYGLNNLVVNFENEGSEIKKTGVLNGAKYYFSKGITWSALTSSLNSFRYSEEGFLFDSNKGPMMFPNDKHINFILGWLNTKVVQNFINILNPTMSVQNGDIDNLPFVNINKIPTNIFERVKEIVSLNIKITKNDWNSYETSWAFTEHPLLHFSMNHLLQETYNSWETFMNERFLQLKSNEEELNQIFINIYGIQDELTPEIIDKDVTISNPDIERDIKSFISYAIGCSLGRYSLDEEGLIFAGGEFDVSRYQTFKADEDNILPILSGSYFEDDIVGRFVEFVRVTFSVETLEENLNFVADALGRKKNETSRETLRRYFLNDFYKDHVKTYKKRPIYWLFTSGKEKAFNCLVYMHRYDKTTLSRIRTDYLHEVQIRMDTDKKDLLNIIEGDSTTKEISAAKKKLKSLDKKIDELKAYDELLHHMADQQIEIDLDDGVKHNYGLFKGLVAKI